VSTLRLGYVGCGFMAQRVHLPNFSSIPDCELVALAELRPELGAKVQRRYGIPRLYRTHQELIADPDVDAVAVSAAFSAQAQVATDALRAGKCVFMEKPMALSVEQAEEIVAAEREGGARLMVGYMKRYDAGNELVRRHVRQFRASGELGRLQYVRNHGFLGDWVANVDVPLEQTDEPTPPMAPARWPAWLPEDQRGSYAGLLQQYTHNVNLMRWFTDAGDDVRIKTVDLDADGQHGVVILDLAGTRGVLETGRVSYYRWDEHTQLYFEHGWLHTWAPPLLLRQAPAEVELWRGMAQEEQQTTRLIPKPAWSWAYKREAEAFVRRTLAGEPYESSAADTLIDVRLFEEIFRRHLGVQAT
jgi:predicted dehydrogenase